MRGIRIGEVLVEQGVLTDGQVSEILRAQKECGRPFGDLAERMFGISPQAVEDAWVEQYVRISGVIDLDEIHVDSDCLRQLNRRQAWQFHLLPLYREDNELHLATSPNSLVRAINFATRTLNEPVYMMVAERDQLREFLMKHYPVPQHIAQYAETLR